MEGLDGSIGVRDGNLLVPSNMRMIVTLPLPLNLNIKF